MAPKCYSGAPTREEWAIKRQETRCRVAPGDLGRRQHPSCRSTQGRRLRAPHTPRPSHRAWLLRRVFPAGTTVVEGCPRKRARVSLPSQRIVEAHVGRRRLPMGQGAATVGGDERSRDSRRIVPSTDATPLTVPAPDPARPRRRRDSEAWGPVERARTLVHVFMLKSPAPAEVGHAGMPDAPAAPGRGSHFRGRPHTPSLLMSHIASSVPHRRPSPSHPPVVGGYH